jgi:hypothetical protein
LDERVEVVLPPLFFCFDNPDFPAGAELSFGDDMTAGGVATPELAAGGADEAAETGDGAAGEPSNIGTSVGIGGRFAMIGLSSCTYRSSFEVCAEAPLSEN